MEEVVWSIQHKGDTAANWTSANPVLLERQFGVELNAGVYDKLKIGDGVTHWNDLPYFNSGGGGSVVSVEGTNLRITVDNTDPANPIIDIAPEYDIAITSQIAQSKSDAVQESNDYTDSVVVGLWNDRGNYNVNDLGNINYPSTGGSGLAGSIRKGNIWAVANATVGVSTINNIEVNNGDTVRALVDNPMATNDAHWAISENNIGYVPENAANKVDVISGSSSSEYPTENAVVNYVTNEISSKADKVSGLQSGGAITVGSYGGGGSNNDIRVAPAVWYIESGFSTLQTLVNTDFLDITLSGSGLQRFVGLYGTLAGTITKVEGAESEYAAYPTQPADTAIIGFVLVTDSSFMSAPDLSAYATINPRVAAIVSSATPTFNANLYDCLNITALATNITSMTTNFSGSFSDFRPIIIRIKDNGTSRTITWGSLFQNQGGTLPTSTILNKVHTIGLLYNSVTLKFGCVAAVVEI